MLSKTLDGEIVQIISSVLDVKFPDHLPMQNELLKVDAGDRHVKIGGNESP